MECADHVNAALTQSKHSKTYSKSQPFKGLPSRRFFGGKPIKGLTAKLLVLLFIQFSFELHAQETVFELLTGNTEYGVTGNEQGYPLNAWYHDVKHQSLYKANELSSAGLLSGSNITGVQFKVSQTPGMNLDSVRIAYAWTTNTTLTGFTTTSVVYGPVYHPAGNFTANSWVQVNFTTPIVWDGTSNLVIEYSHDNTAYVTGGGVYMRQVGADRGVRGWTDSGAGHYPFNGITNSPDNKVASLKLVVQTADVLPPTNLTATPAYQQVNLSWTASTSSDISKYLIYRGTGADNRALIDSVSAAATTYSSTGLTNGTLYYFGIKAKQTDGDISSLSSPASATPMVETPQNLAATAGSQQVTLNWSAPTGSGVAKTLIYRGFNSDGTGAILADSTTSGTATTKTVTGLANGTQYYFGIRFRGADNSLGLFSNVAGAVPDYTGPDWYVSPTGNDYSGDGSSTGPFATVQQAMNKAAAGDTINLKTGIYSGYGNYDLNPMKNLTIVGIGGADSVTIDLAGSSANRRHGFKLENFTYTNLTIKGLKIINSVSSSGYGGGIIMNNAGNVAIEDCIIGPGNKASAGAGIYIYNTSATILKTIIKGNEADMTENLFYSSPQGVGLHVNNSGSYTVVVKNSVIRDNKGIASGSQYDLYGGGFYLYGTSTTQFINTMIVENELTRSNASGWWSLGGAGAMDNGATAYFVHTDILKNNVQNTTSAADGRGGAIWFNNSNTTAYFLNSIVWGNTASSTIASEDMFAGNYSINSIANYSDMQLAHSGNGNLNVDPEFQDEDNDNFRLSLRSDLLGAGATSAMTTIPGASLISSFDILGNARPGTGGGNPDMGAFENSLSTSPIPEAPTNLSATAGDGQITLSWTASTSTDVTKYGIYYGTAAEPAVKQQEVTGATTVTVTGLQNNVTYYFRITAIDGDGYESGYSNEVNKKPQFSGSTVYVNAASTATNPDGSSLANAFGSIQEAINSSAVTDGKRILVAHGTYTYDAGDWTASGDQYGFSYTDNNGNQQGTFTVSNGQVNAVNFTHTNSQYQVAAWLINSQNTYFNSQYNFSIEAYSSSGLGFRLYYGTNWGIGVEIGTQSSYQSGWNVNVWLISQSGFTTERVVDLLGKKVIVEAISGSDSTFIDGGGQYSALALDAEVDDYTGYGNSTKFIGFTFQNGPSDEALVDIAGPVLTSNLDWSPSFVNCRFINSTVTASDGDVAPIIIENAEPVFENCEFRNLNIKPSSSYWSGSLYFYGPIRILGTQAYSGSSYDTTAFRPRFENCIIAGNTNKRANYTGQEIILMGGAVYVGFGAIPYFENTRIDSNLIDVGTGRYGNTDRGYGGGIALDNYLSRGKYIRFINCSISKNTVKADETLGGGLYVEYPQVLLQNCVVTGNTLNGATADNADWNFAYGGGIFNNTGEFEFQNNPSNDPALKIVNSTIADNTITNIIQYFDGVGGAGIDIDESDDFLMTIFNSIIYDNMIDTYLESQNYRMNIANGSMAVTDGYVLIDYSDVEFITAIGLEGDALFDAEPGFAGNGNYSLSSASVCIGAGIDEFEAIVAPLYDYNNNIRPNPAGSNPDLGAFENSLSTTPYPSKPQNLTVSSIGDSTVVLSWTANTEDDLAKYRIYRGTSAATTLVDSVSGTPSYTADGLNNYTTYYFAISAVDLDGFESGKSNVVSGTPKWVGPIWYVNYNQTSSSGKDGSRTLPFREIQDAIDAVDPSARMDGLKDTILVLPGTYNRADDQNLTFTNSDGSAKNLVLKSRDGAATTILDGEGSNRLLEIPSGSDTTLQVIGFTIKNGGENDGSGSAVKVEGQSHWNGNQEVITYSGVTFINCTFTTNGTVSSPNTDPVLYLYKANVNMIGCDIKNNYRSVTSYSGEGGVIRADFSRLLINRSLIQNNSLTASNGDANGAAIYMGWDISNRLTVTNSIISENTASAGNYSAHAGIMVRGGKATIVNSTIVDNENISNFSNNGSAVYLSSNWDGSSSLTMLNSIVYGNSPQLEQVFFDAGGNTDHYIAYSLIDGSDPNDFEDGVFNGNPEFSDTTYTLHDRSAAIGAGAAESENVDGNLIYAPTIDIVGNVRPNPAGSNPDLGAYEHTLAVTPYPAMVQNLAADPLHQAVLLEWNYHQETDVLKYVAYTSSDSITFAAADTVTGRFNTRTTIGNLTNGVNYWFYVTAVDSANFESSPSLQVKTEPFYQGPVWYVDDGGSTSGEGSPEEPARYIRDMIEASADGDTIMLMPGTYNHAKSRDLNFQYNNSVGQNGVKNLTLMSKYGADTTIINLNGSSFLSLNSGETSSKVQGLKIINGGGNLGAIYINNGSITIEDCIFEDNNFSAVYVWFSTQPVEIINSQFINNYAVNNGGAISIQSVGNSSEVIILQSIFDGNSSGNDAGAITQRSGTNLLILNSLFVNNHSQSGNAGGIMANVGNGNGQAEVLNSIFVGNSNTSGIEPDIDGSGITAEHCILQTSGTTIYNSGDNFVFENEQIINDTANGDYSLYEYSPAIGQGIDEFYSNILEVDIILANELETDYLGNVRIQPVGSNIDLGPIEHERWEQRRRVYYLSPNGSDTNSGLSTAAPFASLSKAFTKSVIRDTIQLAAGTYSGANNRNLDFGGVDRVIRSTSGPATTIINCANQGNAFILEDGETDSTIISGITIKNGSAANGGAVKIDGADPAFDAVIFRDNYASTNGGAVYANNSNAEFVNCVFDGNQSVGSGAIASINSALDLNFITAVGNEGINDVSFSGNMAIANSILWFNSAIGSAVNVTYSDVMGGRSGDGNYNGRPGFVDMFYSDFSLNDWSPVIGKADDSTGVRVDIAGNVRPVSAPDMGAYENDLDEETAYTTQQWFVSTTGSDSVRSGMGSANDPFGSIQFAMNYAIYDDEVRVNPGYYDEDLNNWGKDILIVGDGVTHPDNDVQINGLLKITDGNPALYNLQLTNNGTGNDVLQINNNSVVTMYNLLVNGNSKNAVTINNDATAYMFNMTVYGNTKGINDNSTGSISVTNSIVWNNTTEVSGNPAISYSAVEGGYTGTGNIAGDPDFVDAANANFNLLITSPCVDAGDPTSNYDEDSTVVDMGAFPLIREFLTGTSSGNIYVTDEESAVIAEDFTLAAGDTLNVQPGSTVYFVPDVTMTVNGVMTASGVVGNPVTFACTDPDSTFNGVVINNSSGGRDHNASSVEYILIRDVASNSVPLTVNGDVELNHITIAGNESAVSLQVNSGTVDVYYCIFEGAISGNGTINNAGTFTGSTNQFVSYTASDFTLLSTAAAIDDDTTGDYVDPDYTFGDAGCFYHDQSSYGSGSATVLYPAIGDTVLVSPDTSSTVGNGLTVQTQIFNTLGNYMTNPALQWGNAGLQSGTFVNQTTTGADLRGRVSNTFFTSTVSGNLNVISVNENGTTAQSGVVKVVPGNPDSVRVNEQSVMYMTQFDELNFSANIFDQFANLVSDGEAVNWSIVNVTGSGAGFALSANMTTTAAGVAGVTLSTDPTGNSLSVGDQVRIQAGSGNGTHLSAVVTIIPDDIYDLTMPGSLTEAQIDVSADLALVYLEAALIDTFDNPLSGVEVHWEVVMGNGTGESLSTSSSLTNVNGIAWTDLITSTVSGRNYTVHAWVEDDALLSSVLGNNATQNPIVKSRSVKTPSSGQSALNEIRIIPVRVIPTNTSSSAAHSSRDHSVYDLDDTTAVIHVLPGVTAAVVLPQDSVDVLLNDEFNIDAMVYDQFGNTVSDGTPVTWAIVPVNSYITVVSSENVTNNGLATINLKVEQNAPWDFDFTVRLTAEGITGETGTYNIHDVTPPAAISNLAIAPNVWTSANDFTLTWTNPAEHSGVAGAHYSINNSGDTYVAGQSISTLQSLALPTNAASTFDVWLQDNAGNKDSATRQSIVAKWDNTQPTAFSVTAPVQQWYNTVFLRFTWNGSSDQTAGLQYYELDIDGGNTYNQHKDSTGINIPDGFAEGTHNWTISAFDSAGNERVTTNPKTFYVDYTNPNIAHNPVLEGTLNTPVTITASFTDAVSGIATAELFYRKGGEVQWQTPIDMKTLSTYQIASSFVTSDGVDYYIYCQDVAGNEKRLPASGHYSISVTITGAGLSSTDRWPTGVPNGSSVSSYQLLSFPGIAANNTPNDILITSSLLPAYDNTLWRFYTFTNNDWSEFANISSINPGEGYMLIVKDAGYNIATGQTRTVETDEDFEINFTSGEWVMIGNPFDFSIPASNVFVNESTTLAGDANFYTYDGTNGWVASNSLEPWKGYIYKSATENQLSIKPLKSNGGLKMAQPEKILMENEWLVNISGRNGLGVDKLNKVGVMSTANDEYDKLDAFEPPVVPGGISIRVNNRGWSEHGDVYAQDIRTVKEDGEFWDMEVIAQDDEHNVYLNFEGIASIPEEFDVFAIDVTMGVAQDLRWSPVYRYAPASSHSLHDIRFIAGTKEFVQANNKGVELYPDKFSISQNFPNPFNPQTSILITLEEMSRVDLIIYNILGEEVARLADHELLPVGYHNLIWKGLNREGKRVASGVYFYTTRIQDLSGNTILNQTNKMIMVK